MLRIPALLISIFVVLVLGSGSCTREVINDEIICSPAEPRINDQVFLELVGREFNGYQCIWDFGDGTIDTNSVYNVAHNYQFAQQYHVTLSLEDNGVPKGYYSIYVNVSQ